jgi:ABC-type molybdate transport system substrate-binding protein
LIGSFITSLNELLTGSSWGVINPKKVPGGKKAKKGYQNSGVIHKMGVTVEKYVGSLAVVLECSA